MRFFFVALGALCAPVAAFAQVGAPGGLTNSDPVRALPQPTPLPSAPPTLPGRPAPPAAEAGEEGRFVFRSARFETAQSVPEAALRPAWEKYVGKTVSLGDLRTIAAEAEAIYAERGRPFVAITVPPQSVQDGVIRFEVTEGRITDLTVLGADPVARKQATAVLSPLVDKPGLSTVDVETAYEQSRLVPGLTIAGALRKGSQPGGMDLVVQAEKKRWRVYANANNLYADPVGPGGMLVGADYLGDSRFGDQTSLQAFTTFDIGEQWLVRASHSRRLNARGTTLTLTGLVARANPRGVVAPLDLATDVNAGRIELSQALYQRLNGFITASLALDVSDQKTRVFRTVALTEDRLRILSANLSGEYHNSADRIAFSLEARQGLGILDASRHTDLTLSRLNADPRAFVVRYRLEGETAVHPMLRFAARVEGQYSARSLTSPEEYTVGNLSIGRGYQPGASFGDSAVAAAVEMRMGPYPIPKDWLPVNNVRAQPFLFLDSVRVWNHEEGSPRDHTVNSWGPGVRFELPGRARLDLAYAIPLEPPLGLGEPKPTPRLLANLTVGFDGAYEAMRNLFGAQRRAK